MSESKGERGGVCPYCYVENIHYERGNTDFYICSDCDRTFQDPGAGPPGNNVGLLDVIAEMKASTLWLSNSVAGWVEKLEAIARAPEKPEQERE